MSVLQKLTEGIVHRDVTKEGAAMLSKWEQTGLLEGLSNERTKNTMAVLLENQAKELLREASGMAAGDVEGFASVAFPIVRRVFGGLIANDIVSVQPMSLPSGLIFFLDFLKSGDKAGVDADDTGSVYGGLQQDGSTPARGRDIQDGIRIDGDPGGFYNLGGTFSSPKVSVRVSFAKVFNGAPSAMGDADRAAVRHDPDALDSGNVLVVKSLGQASDIRAEAAGAVVAGDQLRKGSAINLDLLRDAAAVTGADEVAVAENDASGILGHGAAATALTIDADHKLARRLTHVDGDGRLVLVFTSADAGANAADPAALPANLAENNGGIRTLDVTLPAKDTFDAVPSSLGAVVGGDQWGLESQEKIPEIDIKVDSIAVTAMTKKLKAKWTPELAQDLNAYHSLDAEVELTGILSEQIALEIDQEILGDLVDGATASTMYWSRRPGLFLNRGTGEDITDAATPPDFTGTVSEWYETLVETINDVSAQIHRKVLRGGANFLVTSPEIANILEFTSGFRASVVADQDRGSVGAVKAGSISKKWDVYVDPYFPRNVILVGRKGSSFLESGYVYAPYVPLQTTPTIFGPEDFVPRKGVMTRYAKQMVRPDMYGLVVCRHLTG